MTIRLNTVAEALRSQLRPLSLAVTPGANGYRIALVGGADYENLADYRDAAQAFAVMREAIGATDALLAKVFA